MQLIGLPDSGMIRAYSMADAYGITLEQAKGLKTCSEKVEIDPGVAQRLIDAGFAQEFTFEAGGGQ